MSCVGCGWSFFPDDNLMLFCYSDLFDVLALFVLYFSVLNISWVFGNKSYFLAPCCSQGKLS